MNAVCLMQGPIGLFERVRAGAPYFRRNAKKDLMGRCFKNGNNIAVELLLIASVAGKWSDLNMQSA
jgi:hypothetical protein